ncbi:MAG: hypothetical protein IJ646_10585 [Clostridia bacterium]|nr:hypothetical protein [Clostridia bacterium]
MKKLLLVCSVALCLLLGSMAVAEGAGVTAVLADAGQAEAGFVAILAQDGTIYSEFAVESFASLIKANDLTDDASILKLAVIPDNGEEYPYLYPDGDWKIVAFADALPEWYDADAEAAVLEAFEAWKAEAYSIFDPAVLLDLQNPQAVDVDMTGVSDDIQQTLDRWADVDTNWMVCYVRNGVPTTTQAAVGKSIANDAWNYAVNMIWTQTGEDLAGHSQVDLIAAYVGSAFPGITEWQGYFGSGEGYPFADGAKLIASGYLYANGLYSAKEVKAFDDDYDPDQYLQLTRLAEVKVNDTGAAFACLIDEDGNVYWSLGTDYVSGLVDQFGVDEQSVVKLNVGPKDDKGNQSVGTAHAASGWSELENGYFATGAWEEPDVDKPEFFAADGSANWRMNADGTIEPGGEDMSEAGAPINPGKYSYIDGDTTWEVMIAGNGNCTLTEITAEDLAKAAEQQDEGPRSTYFNTPAPMTEVKSVGPVPAWYDARKDEIDELAKKAYADWQDQILELVDVDALNDTLKGMGLDYATPLDDKIMADFKKWVTIWNEDAVAGSINIGISTLGYKAVGPSIWNEIDNTVLANYKSMDHEGCPGPTTSTFIAAYALEHYGKVIDAATDDYMGSTMNDVYSAHVGSFIKGLKDDADGNYVYQVAHDLWEAGCIPFFDGEYWYLVSGPDFDPDGDPAVEVIYSATPAEILAD